MHADSVDSELFEVLELLNQRRARRIFYDVGTSSTSFFVLLMSFLCIRCSTRQIEESIK